MMVKRDLKADFEDLDDATQAQYLERLEAVEKRRGRG